MSQRIGTVRSDPRGEHAPGGSATSRSWLRLLLGAVAGSILVVLGTQLLVGAVTVGVTVDEPIHVERLQQWLDTGWYVPERFLVDASPDPDEARSSPFVYGAAFSAVAHVANVAVGNESWGEVSRSAASYAVRHLTVAFLSLAAVVAVGLAVQAATRDRVAGLWGAAGLLAVPVWTGHSMFNVKDVPTAAGYTLLTAALMVALTGLRAPSQSRWRGFGVAILAALGMFFAVGTRTAMWVPLVASVATFVVLVALAQRDLRSVGRAVLAPIAGSVVGLAAVVALHPANAATPVRWFLGAVTDSSEFPWTGYTLTAGRLLSEEPPLWYLPAWVGASLPLLMTLLIALGLCFTGMSVVRPGPKLAPVRGSSDPIAAAPLLAVQQALLLPVAAMVTGSVLYSGMRQHLYLLPALAVLAGTGAGWLLRSVGSARHGATRSSRRYLPIAVAVLLTVALVKPTVEQFWLHPYNYVYVNAVAGLGGINDRWETDYWGASNREALRRVPSEAELRCSNWLVRPWEPRADPAIGGCGGRHEVFVAEIGLDARSAAADDEVWVVGRVRGGNRVPAGCSPQDNVTRRLRGEQVLVGFVLSCDAAALE